ncbi:MAG: helix-turn-helix transcriptional regulator [Terriglobia bacterium]|jgi:transcriptional regulator with XRE-family HTH domain
MNHPKLFRIRLGTLRKPGGITQEEAAEKARLNPKYLGQIERGEKRPSFDATITLAKALQASSSASFQFEREGTDERTLRKNIDALLRPCTAEQLRQVHQVIKALVEA